jgi:hypothetical protein
MDKTRQVNCACVRSVAKTMMSKKEIKCPKTLAKRKEKKRLIH